MQLGYQLMFGSLEAERRGPRGVSDSSFISDLGAINPNHKLVVPGASKNMTKNGSTKKTEISGDDKTVELPVVGKPLDPYLEDSCSEMDYVAGGGYLEVNDLDDPASPSSCSDNSSCLTMSSDAKFDAMARLQDLDCNIYAEIMIQGIRFIAPSKLKKDVVHPGPSESLVNAERSDPLAEEKPKTNPTVPKTSPPVKGGSKEPDTKQLQRQGEKAGNGSEGASPTSSSASHSEMVWNGQEPDMNWEREKKTAVGEVKKKKNNNKNNKKKYFCFIPFDSSS